jgi:hypothetical protein
VHHHPQKFGHLGLERMGFRFGPGLGVAHVSSRS